MSPTRAVATQKVNYAQALGGMPLPFLRSDASGLIILANAAAKDLLGAGLIGKHVRDLYGTSLQASFIDPHSVKSALMESPDHELTNVTVPIRLADGSFIDMLCSFRWDPKQGIIDSIIVPRVVELERALGRIAESLVHARRLEDTLNVITQEASFLCRSDRAYIKLYDQVKKVLVFKALISKHIHDELPTEPSPIDRGMTGYVFCTRKPYLSRDVRLEPSDVYYSIFNDTRSKVVVPLVRYDDLGNQVCYGVLSVDGNEENQFGFDTVETLTTLAQNASIALAQVRQFHEVREDYNELLKEHYDRDIRRARNFVHHAKNMVRNIVYDLESIEEDLNQASFGRKRSREIHKRLDGLRGLYDLMGEMLSQLKGEPSKEPNQEEQAVHLRAIALRARNIMPFGDDSIDFEVAPEDFEYRVYGRATQLLFILYNLMTNAVNAIKRSKRRGKVCITISSTPNRSGFVRLQVADDGPGLPRLALDVIRNGESYSSGMPGGSGLGLLTVRETVKVLKGSIDVDSKFGEGARFVIDLPGIGDSE